MSCSAKFSPGPWGQWGLTNTDGAARPGDDADWDQPAPAGSSGRPAPSVNHHKPQVATVSNRVAPTRRPRPSTTPNMRFVIKTFGKLSQDIPGRRRNVAATPKKGADIRLMVSYAFQPFFALSPCAIPFSLFSIVFRACFKRSNFVYKCPRGLYHAAYVFSLFHLFRSH